MSMSVALQPAVVASPVAGKVSVLPPRPQRWQRWQSELPWPDTAVYYDVEWALYERALRLRDRLRPAARITYDRGTLEIVMPSRQHEVYSRLICALVSHLTVATRTPVSLGGSTTLKRQLLDRGIEGDEVFWVAREAAVRGKRELDLDVDPPPDLAVEVDITHSAVDREAIYAALGVPERWTFKPDAGLRASRLVDGAWQPIEFSLAFPMLRVADLGPFLARAFDDHMSVTADAAEFFRGLAR